MRKTTYVAKIESKLSTLKVGESFDKKEFIKENWGAYDFFIDRTFSVAFSFAKKTNTTKTFKTIAGQIIRTK